MLPVSTAIEYGAPFKVTASCCDLPQRQYFEDLFNENGGVFLYDKSAYLSQNYKKTMLSWKSSEGAREKGEEGDRRGGLFLRSSIMSLSQAHYNWAKKQIKLKSLRIDGNPRKRKRVEICNTFSLPVACQSAVGQAKIFPPKINACVLCVRVLCKTRRSFIRSLSGRVLSKNGC